MNKRRVFLAAFLIAAAAIAGFGLFSLSKPDTRIFRVGVINYAPAAEPALDGLKAGLRERGFVEGTNVAFIYSGSITDKTRLESEAERLNDMNVDVIYAMSTPGALAAKKATRNSSIPVVFGPVSSPVEAGIIDRMGRPGDNLTGVAVGFQEPKRLEILLKIVPDVRKIYVPFNPDEPNTRLNIERIQTPAAKLGVSLQLEEIGSEAELMEALIRFPDDADAVFMPADPLMVHLTDLLVDFCLEKRLPLSTPHRRGVAKGALYSYGFSIRDVGHQAARLAAQIFNGARPGDLPVELTEFSLSLNLTTAKHLDIPIPEDLLRHAIIENNLSE